MFYRSDSTQPGTKSGNVFVCKDIDFDSFYEFALGFVGNKILFQSWLWFSYCVLR